MLKLTVFAVQVDALLIESFTAESAEDAEKNLATKRHKGAKAQRHKERKIKRAASVLLTALCSTR